MGHSDIETEHLLLGLLPEENGPGAQIPRDFDGEADPKLRNAVIRALSGAARRGHRPHASASRGDLTVNPGWFEGVAPLLEVLTDGIRAHLGRKPDTGDLLIALTAVSESLAARALSELGVDAAGLAEAVARMRSNGVVPAEDAIERTRQRKEVALEAEEFELARQLREQERRLTQALRSNRDKELEAVRQRLNIPDTGNSEG